MNIISIWGGKLILHCREFNINGYPINIGHDRESGIRYLLTACKTEEDIYNEIPAYLTGSMDMVNQLKSIFWIQ